MYRQTVSLYDDTSVRLDTQDASRCDPNTTDEELAG